MDNLAESVTGVGSRRRSQRIERIFDDDVAVPKVASSSDGKTKTGVITSESFQASQATANDASTRVSNKNLVYTMDGLDKETIDSLIMKVDTEIPLDSVILSDENRHMIEEFLRETKYRDQLLAHKLEPMNRLLFYGASGCGKTYLSKALSQHMGYKMLYIDIAEALSTGKVAKNLSAIFQYGNALGNCIIFLDECDSIAWSRDSNNSESGDVRRATNSLFQQIDQMNPTNIIISATNMLRRLDPAFERRFNMKLEFRRPKENLMDTIRKFLYDEFSLTDDMDENSRGIVERRTKMSYDEIKGMVHRAMKKAVMDGTLNVKSSTIYKDIADAMHVKTRFGTDEDSQDAFKSSIE